MPTAILIILGFAFIGAAGFAFLRFERAAPPEVTLIEVGANDTFVCSPVKVVDGDTIGCGNERVRLAGIDTPEMPGHCRVGRDCAPGDPFKSKAMLESLAANGQITCERQGTDRYGRTLASCSVAGVNLSCELVAKGLAIVRYGGYPC